MLLRSKLGSLQCLISEAGLKTASTRVSAAWALTLLALQPSLFNGNYGK